MRTDLLSGWCAQILGVPPGTKKDVIKKAYKELSLKMHPDKHPEGPAREEATRKFMELQAAFNSLMTTEEEDTVEALAAAAHKH